MSKRLILIRHAKSSWDLLDTPDHERALNERGRLAARAIGDWLNERDYVPEATLCSDASRTRETWALISERLDSEIPCTFSYDLYLATPADMLQTLGTADANSVAIIGHNPGIGALATSLAETLLDHPKFRQYPTCATTVLDFDIDAWSEIQPNTGRLVDFIVPRDLTD